MDKEITIDGEAFSLVAVQRAGTSAVYRSHGRYMRLGQKAKTQRDLDFHKKMEASGFPVAKVVGQGEYRSMFYFLEESLPGRRFGDLFADDCAGSERVSDGNFQPFLDITLFYARAQLTTILKEARISEFEDGIHLADLCRELPADADMIREHFSDVMKGISAFPFVLTHGDFNPHNLYPAGVIDLEDSFYGPAGYDMVTNIAHIDWFPASREYEFFQKYRFDEDQKRRYWAKADALYESRGLPKISLYRGQFEFCRGVWSAVHMRAWPKIQEFRYKKLKEKFLSKI